MSVWSWSPVTQGWPLSGTSATSVTWGAPAGSLAGAGSGEAGAVQGQCHAMCPQDQSQEPGGATDIAAAGTRNCPQPAAAEAQQK